jgi:hypothetical protein
MTDAKQTNIFGSITEIGSKSLTENPHPHKYLRFKNGLALDDENKAVGNTPIVIDGKETSINLAEEALPAIQRIFKTNNAETLAVIFYKLALVFEAQTKPTTTEKKED